MDGVSETFEGQQPQSRLNDDVLLPEEEIDQCDDTSKSQENMTPFNDFENEVPHYLPEKALMTCSSSLLRADGNHETYLTIHNAPSHDYVAQKINDGHEFAIGGDASHILKSLDREFLFQPQQRWHVIVISENTLQLTGVPRQSYPLISRMTDGSFQSGTEGVELQQKCSGDGDIMVDDGPVGHTGQDQLNEQGRDLDGLDGAQQSNILTNGKSATDLEHVLDNHYRTTLGRFRQSDSIDDMMIDTTNEPTDHPSGHQQGISSMPPHPTPIQDRPSQWAASSEHNKRNQPHQQSMDQREEEGKQKSEDALIVAADHRFGSYVGTNLCRWCSRRGHEAVQCIKWDPEHFDKLVCIVCNNKKHLLDDCLRFQVMSEEEKVKLVLVDGANRPGARSFFWPWVRVFATSSHNLSMQPNHSGPL